MEDLQAKSLDELLAICEDREIEGVGNLPKDMIVQILVNDMQEKNEIPTKEELMTLSATELREILEDKYEITGMENQPKNFLVEIILSAAVKKVLTAVQANVTVQKDVNNVTSKVTVNCGGNHDDFSVVGYTVDAVVDLLKEVLNVPAVKIAVVNGNTVGGDYTLQDGDVLDFIPEAEKKGN